MLQQQHLRKNSGVSGKVFDYAVTAMLAGLRSTAQVQVKVLRVPNTAALQTQQSGYAAAKSMQGVTTFYEAPGIETHLPVQVRLIEEKAYELDILVWIVAQESRFTMTNILT